MENTGFKGLLRTLYQRVILSYKTTLIGLGIAAADVVIEYTQAADLPTWAHTLIGLVAAAFVLVKAKHPTLPPPPNVGAGAVALVLVGSMLLSGCAFFRPLEPKLVQCLTSPAGAVLQDVGGALDHHTPEIRLDELAIKYGIEAVLCALGVFVDALEQVQINGGAGSGGPLLACTDGPCTVDNTTRLIRARAYLAEARVRFQLAP